jgi:hypothetical protein
MATDKPTWTKAKGKSAAGLRLPPLTTDKGKIPTKDWHKITMAQGIDQPALWSVTWDTTRRDAEPNTAQDTTQSAAFERARKFLSLGFVVYSIVDPTGVDSMTEAAINERFKPVR